MKNYISDGDTLTFTADTNGVSSGDGVLQGTLFGVACVDAGASEDFEAQVVGVFELPKDASDITVGAAIYWTGTACTTTVGSNTLIGAATAAADTDATTVSVRLNGVAVA